MSKYLIDYHINGHAKYFDFYLFVNPLGRKCFFSEQEISRTKALISSKVDLNILCVCNEYILNDFLSRIGLTNCSLKVRNEVYHKLYHTALAIKSASLQGKQKSRHYFLCLENNLEKDMSKLTQDTLYQIAELANLDIDLFIEDYQSKLVRKLYLNDLKIAQSMTVHKTPTLVVFDSTNDLGGYKIEDNVTLKSALGLLDQMMICQCDCSPINIKSTHPLFILH